MHSWMADNFTSLINEVNSVITHLTLCRLSSIWFIWFHAGLKISLKIDKDSSKVHKYQSIRNNLIATSNINIRNIKNTQKLPTNFMQIQILTKHKRFKGKYILFKSAPRASKPIASKRNTKSNKNPSPRTAKNNSGEVVKKCN